MIRRRQVRPDGRIPFSLRKSERDLLLDLVLVDSELEQPLRVASVTNSKLVVSLTPEDVDSGNVAAEANHAEDAKRRRARQKL
jgi:hypothetical protein